MLDSETVLITVVGGGAVILLAWTKADDRFRRAVAATFTNFLISLLRLLSFVASLGTRGRLPFLARDDDDRALRRHAVDLFRPAKSEHAYDFVVIGGGAAGLAAVHRLMTNKDNAGKSVLLVESGPMSLGGDDESSGVALPADMSALSLPAFALQTACPRHGRASAPPMAVSEAVPVDDEDAESPEDVQQRTAQNRPRRPNREAFDATGMPPAFTPHRSQGLDGATATDDAAVYLPAASEWSAVLGDSGGVAKAAADAQELYFGPAEPAVRPSDAVPAATIPSNRRSAVPSWPSLVINPLCWAFRVAAIAKPDDDDAAASSSSGSSDETGNADQENGGGDANEASVVEPARIDVLRTRHRWAPHLGFRKQRLSAALVDDIESKLAAESGKPVPTLHLACGAVAEDVVEGGAKLLVARRATAAEMAATGTMTSGTPVPVSVRRGIVVAAGARSSAGLVSRVGLKRVEPVTPTAAAHNTPLRIPLVYQAQPGLTFDATNTQSLLRVLTHVAQCGNYEPEFIAAAEKATEERGSDDAEPMPAVLKSFGWVAQMAEGSLRVTLSAAGAGDGQEVFFVQLLPAGGFNRDLFKSQGWSKALGVFKEAFSFVITVPSGSRTTARSAIRWCREFFSEGRAPLCHLSTGREALDLSLMLHAPRDAFKLLYGKPRKVRGREQMAALQERAGAVFRKVRELAESDDYLDEYIDAHGQDIDVDDGAWFAPGDVGRRVCVATPGAMQCVPKSAKAAGAVTHERRKALRELVTTPNSKTVVDVVCGVLAADRLLGKLN